MAEETMVNEERVKLFVGQVPKHMTETQLLTLFREFSIVDEVNIIKEKTKQASRGFFFPLFSQSSSFNLDLFFFEFFSVFFYSVLRILVDGFLIRVISSWCLVSKNPNFSKFLYVYSVFSVVLD